jgi:cytochrome oxidase Cu insertion factor (SCO1/SenC/PrrC family)
LAFWLVVTAGWWALALWPLAEQTPDWLARTRAICFNTTPSGLPDPSGWLLLIGQPIGMLAALLVIWKRSVREGLRALAGARAGRALIATTLVAVIVGLGAAATRVVSASAQPVAVLPGSELPPDTYPRLDREAPSLGLIDQHGRTLDLTRLHGRPALVTFAFGHCETVCPLIVRQALEARTRQRALASDAAAGSEVPRVVVVTLDPWRDTPSRLPRLAQHWDLSDDDFMLSGEVDAVNAVLDAWNVARERDPATGSVVHPPLVYVLDASGRIAYATDGNSTTLVALLDRL